MANYFPPTPVYPKNYDSDYTLFLVYNTSETITTEDNAPWAAEIAIKPIAPDKDELWATNGFANIEGELFYYDDVGYNIYGKINKLKRCARNIGGTHTKHNRTGSEVRGFVIAEHHNQIVDAIVKIEDFVGANFTEEQATLDWRIRHLQQLPVIFDDFSCPDVSFDFYIVSDDPATGIVARYTIVIDGVFTSYRLDFGDGEFTTTSTRGTHRYAPNAAIDPIITIANSKCTIVQSPVERTVATEPPPQNNPTTFEIKIPTIPNIPPFNPPIPPTPSNIVTPPPIVFPCLDIGPIGSINIPSVIVIEPPINLPSIIEIVTPFSLPSLIEITPIDLPTLITITSVNIPTLISFGPVSIPTLISFGPVSIPTLINFGPVSIPTLINFGPVSVPTLINFGPVSIPTLINFGPVSIPTLINFGPVSVPTLISFGPVSVPTLINFGPVSVPTLINFGPISVPTLINFGPVSIPSTINFGPVSIPSTINFGPVSLPSTISFGPVSLPSTISFGPTPTLGPISFGPTPTLGPISFGPTPTLGPISFGPTPTLGPISFGPTPTVSVNWGTPPTCSCTVTISCPSGGGGPSAFRAASMALNDGLSSDFDPIEVQMTDLGIPSEIFLRVPEIPDIRVLHDIPQIIRVEAPKIPDIKIIGPATPLPSEIRIVSDSIPSFIELVAYSLPKSIILDTASLPRSIKLEVPESFPSIKIDASGIPTSIQVVGIPSSIELIGAPSEIRLVMPEKPEIELVYKGAPIDVKINLDISRLTGDDGNAQCVAIVPCTPK